MKLADIRGVLIKEGLYSRRTIDAYASDKKDFPSTRTIMKICEVKSMDDMFKVLQIEVPEGRNKQYYIDLYKASYKTNDNTHLNLRGFAKLVGISTKALYKHFDNFDALKREAV